MTSLRHVEAGVLVDDWSGLYKESWTGVIVPEAFAHPAKYSRALIRFIYQHVIDCGWIKPGDSVCDPFGGVALGGFDAMQNGLHWIGCELEEKFVGLGNQNIALWNERYSRMPNWGTARLIQGDSRQLSTILDKARLIVSSPPYASGCAHNGGDDPKPEHIKGGEYRGVGIVGAISSPPYVAISPEKSSKSVDYRKQYETYRSQGGGASFEKFVATQELHSQGYGDSDGQLSAMRSGSFDAAITSHPYAELAMRGAGEKHDKVIDAMKEGYGKTNGQLGGMKDDQFQAAISSPPYEATDTKPTQMGQGQPSRANGDGAGRNKGDYLYGQSDGQLGVERGEDFWSASRIILEQLYQVIVPGGHAVFVVKAFVRNKQIVDFPAQWAQLCEAVGFRLLHDHHALLKEKKHRQPAMDDFDIQGDTWRLVTRDRDHSVARKSFFRRLAESKGSPKIDHENVLCFERPL